MILVTVGTQKFQMNRLIQAADTLCHETGEEMFIQRGHSTYVPKYAKYEDFVDADRFKTIIENCDVCVCHSGVGTIMSCKNFDVPVVVVPRMSDYEEHVDNHQVEIAEAFASKNMVLACKDVAKLGDAIEKAKVTKFSPYEVKGGNIEDIILDFINLF